MYTIFFAGEIVSIEWDNIQMGPKNVKKSIKIYYW